MSGYRLLVVLPVAACVAGAGLWWYATQRPLKVPVAAVETEVPIKVFGLGTVEARVLSNVGFETGGMLMAINADHGDRVAAGTVLASLGTASQEAKVAKAEAVSRSADAQAKRTEAQFGRANAALAQKESSAKRRRDLADRSSGSQEAAELAETEVQTATADRNVAEADREVARAAQADARANLLAEQTTLAKHRLIAPFDALVLARKRELGAALNPGEAVFTLVDPATIWVLAYVDEGRAGDLAVGQPATITLRSRPATPFAGTIARIGLESDRVTEERRVYVTCQNCPSEMVVGEQAEVVIETGRIAKARLVPENAVHGYDGVAGTVWVVDGGQLDQRRVRFAARTIDARLAITDAVPDAVAIATTVGAGFSIGRAATVVGSK
jgi:HlyD family secretion protein